MKPATPTRHGQWRQLENGDLIDESTLPVIASTDERVGGPGMPVPEITEPTESTLPASAGRKSKPKE